MNYNYKIIIAFLLGAILRILTNPWILGYSNENYSIHKNKIYDALFFGSLTGLVQIIINKNLMTNGGELLWIIFFISLIILFKYLINNQSFIKGKDLLLKIKENYGESIKLSQIQLEKNDISAELRDFLIRGNKLKHIAIQDIDVLLQKY